MNIKSHVIDQISEKEVIDFLRELIQTPSVNPPGEEKEIAKLVATRLGEIGMDVQTVAAAPSRSNVVGRLQGHGEGDVLILNTHMDTVPPGEPKHWNSDPFSGEIKGRRVYGRGACDNKGSLAAMIMAAHALQRADVKLNGDLLLMAVADEEAGGEKGTKYLVEKGLINGNFGIACGVSNLDTIYVAGRGVMRLEMTTKGKLAHAALPHLGINAVEKMAKIILAIKDIQLVHTPHGLLGSPTIASGTMIEGGVKVNMIPDVCKASFDIRTVPGQSAKQILNEIQKCLDNLAQNDPELNAAVEMIRFTEPTEISETEKVVQIAKEATEYVTGMEPKIAGLPGATDARFLNSAGIPTIVNFGPGSLDQCHVANEHIEIDQVVAATKIYALTALNVCGSEKLTCQGLYAPRNS